jgi:hypothetical protein
MSVLLYSLWERGKKVPVRINMTVQQNDVLPTPLAS